MKEEEKKEDLRFVTSLVTAFPDEGQLRHFQFSVFHVEGTDLYRCYFDVVDPSQVKLADQDD